AIARVVGTASTTSAQLGPRSACRTAAGPGLRLHEIQLQPTLGSRHDPRPGTTGAAVHARAALAASDGLRGQRWPLRAADMPATQRRAWLGGDDSRRVGEADALARIINPSGKE